MLNNTELSSGFFLGCIDRQMFSSPITQHVLCPFDGRLLLGCNNCDFNKDCSNYCLKDIMHISPDIKKSVLERMLIEVKNNKYNLFRFKKKNISLPALLSKEEKEIIQEKLQEKTNSREEEFKKLPEYKTLHLKEKQLKENLVCVYGNKELPIPKDFIQNFFDKISMASNLLNIIEIKNKDYYNLWYDGNYVGSFHLNDISIGISYYMKESKKYFWCNITKGDNITIKNLEGNLVFEADFYDFLEPLFLFFRQKAIIYSRPSKTYINSKNIVPYENILCDTCSLLNICNGGCPYRRLVNNFFEQNTFYL